jgi:hypothetical protein
MPRAKDKPEKVALSPTIPGPTRTCLIFIYSIKITSEMTSFEL